MLGFGWLVWDKRCPSGKRCAPPVYGNYASTYIKVPQNSPRFNGDQAEAVVSAPWKAGIPRGNDVCIKTGSRGNIRNVAPLKSRTSRKENRNLRPSPNEVFARSKSNINDPCSHPSFSNISQSCTGCYDNNVSRKKLFNVMWDPKVCRGPTMVQFEEAQRAKWKRQLDSHQATLNRELARRRRKKMKEEEYLNTRSNPMRKIVYPPVTIQKEPLTNSSFDLYLTEQIEAVEQKNASQITDEAGAGPPHGRNQNRNSSYFGISAAVQTDESNCIHEKQKTEDWISSTMIDKIPEQAILELQEEAELEALKGENNRYELVFLYRKWQEMKASQWNEYLCAWNEIRMEEILDQDAHLQKQQERIVVIGFCRNAISSCFQRTFEVMKHDGYISKHGIPYGESEELNERLDYRENTEENFEKYLLARKVVESTLINAAIQRFSEHMSDDYGRPHGIWLSRRGRRESIDYDMDLQRYLESHWMKRRQGIHHNLANNSLFSETSLLDIFDYYKDSKHAMRPKTLKRSLSNTAIKLRELIQKTHLGYPTGKNIMFSGSPDNDNGEDELRKHRSSNDEDLLMLYKRLTRWSKLDFDDEKHHALHYQQQHHFPSLGSSGQRGSRQGYDGKQTGTGTKGRNIDGDDDSGSGGAKLPFIREEVDNDKLGVLRENSSGSDSDKRRTELPLVDNELSESGESLTIPVPDLRKSKKAGAGATKFQDL